MNHIRRYAAILAGLIGTASALADRARQRRLAVPPA